MTSSSPLATARAKRDELAGVRRMLQAVRIYEVGPQRREELEHILRRLYISGYLDDVTVQPDEADTRSAKREAAMKLWWSR